MLPCFGVPLFWDDLHFGNCYVDIVRTTSHQTFEARHPYYEIQMEYQVYDCECKLTDCSSSATTLSFADLADLQRDNYSHPHHFLYREGIYGDTSNPDWVDSYNYLLLTSVAVGACSGKSSLQSVRLPDTLKWIGDGAFSNCPNLTSATIPNSVTNIGGNVFSGCPNLAAIACASGGSYVSVDGVLYNSARTKLIKYPEGKTDRFFVVPATVTELAPYCFANTKLDAVLFEGNCPTFASTSFAGSDFVVYRHDETSGWPGNPTSFDHWWDEAMRYISSFPRSGSTTIDGTTTRFEIVDGVLYAFSIEEDEAILQSWGSDFGQDCIPRSVSGDLTIPSRLGGKTVTTIFDAFWNCYRLTSITIPDGVTRITENSIAHCSGLTSVTIPASVEAIGWMSLIGCSRLASIVVDKNNPFYDSRNGCNAIIDTEYNMLVVGCMNTVIPDGVTSICDDAFSYCSGLTSIAIPDSVTSIGWDAFKGCSDELFDTNSIPGVMLVDGWAVDYTDSLQGALDLSGVRGIADDAFRDCSRLSSVTIPNGVTSIGLETFYDCSGLTSITIPDSVTSIGWYAFQGCSEELFDTNSVSGVMLVDGWAVDFTDSLQGELDLTGVRGIGDGAFYDCSGLMSVTIPDSVTSIGDYVFDGCSALASVILPRNLEGIVPDLELSGGCRVLFRDESLVAEGVEIPVSWIADQAAPTLAACSGNCDAAMVAMAANGVNKVWECYVAGLSPTDMSSRFDARIEFDAEGRAIVKWAPDLGAARDYVVEGKALLSDGWGPTNANSRFFRVKVVLPTSP